MYQNDYGESMKTCPNPQKENTIWIRYKDLFYLTLISRPNTMLDIADELQLFYKWIKKSRLYLNYLY